MTTSYTPAPPALLRLHSMAVKGPQTYTTIEDPSRVYARLLTISVPSTVMVSCSVTVVAVASVVTVAAAQWLQLLLLFRARNSFNYVLLKYYMTAFITHTASYFIYVVTT